MPATKEALAFLESEIGKTEKRTVLSFEDYITLAQKEPQKVLRNIFQLFYDMVKTYVGEGVDEYPDDPESIGFVKYDCSKLLAKGADNPFFADRLFANRLIRQVEGLRQGFQQNRMYAYLGPSGCGKSTFFNNLLRTLEAYTDTNDGQMFEIVWEIDESLFIQGTENHQKLIVLCPSHDCPILIIPKKYRAEYLNRLLPDGTEIKSKIFKEKQYEWLFRGEVCTICKSIFELSLEKLASLEKVLSMFKARTHKFDRRLGEGVSIFNPGDKPVWGMSEGKPIMGEVFTNKSVQEELDKIFGTNSVKYVFSTLAKTNNGIYVLMDVKSHNEERLHELHNVISEGIHKVSDIEEQINSLFFALMNPEDKKTIEGVESFKGRIQYNIVPYVLESSTEVNIYGSIFGKLVEERFLPRVLENFARVIISSRMKVDCKPLKEWIPDIKKYEKYCDEYGLLLRMELYKGIIPDWLSEEDKKRFVAPVRRTLIAEGESEGEGDHGFSGRESIQLFSEFFSRYSGRSSLISMDNVDDFFKHRIGRDRRNENIPRNFLASLINSYDYTVLNEVKGSIYFYNQERISKDILNYLYAVNYDPVVKVKCPYTKEEMEITLDFLKLMASRISGKEIKDQEAINFAKDIQKKYVVTVSKEGTGLIETELYSDLFNAYVKNLKEKVLQPFVKNANFREAVKVFGTKEFETFETRLREHIVYMMENLVKKFDYTEQGAKEMCLYVIDKDLAEKFS